MLIPRYDKFVPGLWVSASEGRFINTGIKSGDSELISRSAEPLRSSSARTTASGTMRK
jgi:hypothetical protein